MGRLHSVICFLTLVILTIPVACSGVGGGGSDLTTIDLGPQEDVVLVDSGQDSMVPLDIPVTDLPLPDLPDLPDTGQDLAMDVPTDSGKLDTGPHDPGITDPGKPDVKPIADPVFRASELVVLKPSFCLDLGAGSECADVSKTINAYIAASIASVDAPMNLLFRLTPFLPQDPSVDLLVGNGTCQFENGQPVGCAYSGAEDPVLFEGPLFLACQPNTMGSCFETTNKKIEMLFMGIFLALHDAVLSGRVDDAGFEIQDGKIYGFVPVNTTKSIQVTLPGGSSYLLYDFLKHNPPEDLKGVKGYWFEFDFRAAGVEYL